MELLFKDVETVERQLEKLKKQAKSGKKEDQKKVEYAIEILAHLEAGKPGRSLDLDGEAADLLKDMLLLTTKPILYVCNVDELSVQEGNEHTARFKEAVKDENAEVILISAGIEADIAELDTMEERLEFLADMGLEEPGVNRVIQGCYKLLNLITYFTAGEKEARAWTIRSGWKAPKAAGVIHTDFERGFIRAEVIKYEDYMHYGSESAVKDAGKMSVEGKEYVVEDADVMLFRFNV